MPGTEVIPVRSSNMNNNNEMYLEDITDNLFVHENLTEVMNHGSGSGE